MVNLLIKVIKLNHEYPHKVFNNLPFFFILLVTSFPDISGERSGPESKILS